MSPPCVGPLTQLNTHTLQIRDRPASQSGRAAPQTDIMCISAAFVGQRHSPSPHPNPPGNANHNHKPKADVILTLTPTAILTLILIYTHTIRPDRSAAPSSASNWTTRC